MKRAFCVLLICVLLCGCTGQTRCQRTVFAMDTVMDLQIWSQDESALDAVEDIIRNLERRWSVTDENSALSKYNRGEDPDWTVEEQALLSCLEELSRRTDGAFDPTLGALTEIWGFYSGEYRVPAQSQIDAALTADKLDVGAALKGYAGKLASEELESLGVSCALLNLGGNIQTLGTKPDGTPWQIGIQHPEGGANIGVLSVIGTKAIVTSGDYQRCFEVDGKRYHHIFDAVTGYPADSGLTSVTVICEDGLLADVLSTALFVMGLDDATAFWRQEGGFEAVFITQSGAVYATSGAALSGCEYEVIAHEE